MTIYFDLTTALNLRGNPVGIPRVVQSIGLHFNFPDVCFTRFDIQNKCFTKASISASSNEEIEFQAGDMIVSMGCNWEYSDYNSVVSTLKNEHGLKFVLMVHDIIPVLFPWFVDANWATLYNKWLDEAFASTDIFLTVSENSKRDLENLFIKNQLPSKPVHVIRLGDEIKRTDSPTDLINEEYVLCVGTLEFRKNQQILINAWKILLNEHFPSLPKLVLVGKRGWMDGNLEGQIAADDLLKDKVLILNNISDADLSSLYQKCLFTVYSSRYEGWGLPIAESFGYGKVCVASESSSMVEISKELTLFARPLFVHDWVAWIKKLTSDRTLLKERENLIKAKYIPTSWSQSAKSIYSTLLK